MSFDITEDCDFVVLVAKDETQFPLPSLALRQASPVFSDMMQMPRVIDDDQNMAPELVKLEEDASTLSFIVKFVTGCSIACSGADPTLQFHNVVVAADKYGMDGLQNFLRVYCRAHWNILASDPIALFAAVRKADWREYFWRATRETLKIDLCLPQHAVAMEELLTSDLKLELSIIRGIRKDVFLDILNSNVVHLSFPADSRPTCTCGCPIVFRTLNLVSEALARLLKDLDARPLGDFVWSQDYQLQDSFLAQCDACETNYIDLSTFAVKVCEPSYAERLADLYPLRSLEHYDKKIYGGF
ncbi:hypothetical protein SCHPADRAFT_946310 [Schizopora paradoxa]|uniref:BTB domain-containing protein n=1 Tax=Schizopora paradoxa TaxID=27342 RepID=A0A0H2R337_9AGAM|nr:hypothetical protein SCHPADRAFT_946310 [Schizopora paradoxa]